MTILGAHLCIIFLHFGGARIKEYLISRMKHAKREKKQNKLKKYFDKYGLIGTGIAGTLFLGPHLTIVFGLLLTNKKNTLFVWTSAGILLWTTALTTIGAVSTTLFKHIIRLL
jgi:hypothetical protein